MKEICLSVGVVGAFAVATTLIGRAMIRVLRIHPLQRATPENWLASAFLGTTFLIVVFSTASRLGLRALLATLATASLGTVLLVVQVLMRPARRPPVARRWAGWAAVAVLGGLGILATLLPVLLGDCFCFHTDCFTYDSVSQWLQEHGCLDPVTLDPHYPMWILVNNLKATDCIMGPVFLLALTQSLCPGFLAIHLFPAVIAWGVALNIAGVYLLCRWSFRCPPACAFVAGLLAAGGSPLAFSIAWGFLLQVYGTAALSFSLAVLARLFTQSRWTFGGAALYASAAALLLSVYSPLAPILAVASLVYLPAAAIRAWRTARLRRFVVFAGITLLLLILFANIELIRAVRSICFLVGVNGVGSHRDWSPLDFWSFAVGARLSEGLLQRSDVVVAALGTLLVGAGVARGVRTRRALPALVGLLMLAAMGAYYHWCALDPWTHAVGHTWNQFKVCKYAFPLLVAFQGAGLHQILRLRIFDWLMPRRIVPDAAGWMIVVQSARRASLRSLLLALLCLVILITGAKAHWGQTQIVITYYHAAMQSKTPLTSIRELRKQVERLHASSLYFLGRPDIHPYQNGLVEQVLYPLPFCNNWAYAAGLFEGGSTAVDLNPWPPPDDMVGLMMYGPPFSQPKRLLPCGLSVVDLREPFIIHVENPNGLEHLATGEPSFWIGSEAATIDLWSPQAGQVTLSFDCTAEPSVSETLVRHLTASVENGAVREVVIDCRAVASASLAVAVHAGSNRLKLHCSDPPSLTGSPAAGGNLVRLLSFAHPRLVFSAAP